MCSARCSRSHRTYADNRTVVTVQGIDSSSKSSCISARRHSACGSHKPYRTQNSYFLALLLATYFCGYLYTRRYTPRSMKSAISQVQYCVYSTHKCWTNLRASPLKLEGVPLLQLSFDAKQAAFTAKRRRSRIVSVSVVDIFKSFGLSDQHNIIRFGSLNEEEYDRPLWQCRGLELLLCCLLTQFVVQKIMPSEGDAK